MGEWKPKGYVPPRSSTILFNISIVPSLQPFGSLTATPFSVTADGNFMAFGGYAFNQTQSGVSWHFCAPKPH